MLNKDRPWFGFVGGAFAGTSMMFHKSKTISRYLFAKLLEVGIITNMSNYGMLRELGFEKLGTLLYG